MSLPSFLRAVPHPGAAFPPRGPRGRFPRFLGTMQHSDFPTTFRARFVAFACLVPPPGGVDGLSQVPWKPFAYVPCSMTPAGPPVSSMSPPSVLPSAFQMASAPCDFLYGAQSHGPHARCLRFVARSPRKTRFRLRGSRLGRTGLLPPRGTSSQGFSRVLTSWHPPRQSLLGAPGREEGKEAVTERGCRTRARRALSSVSDGSFRHGAVAPRT